MTVEKDGDDDYLVCTDAPFSMIPLVDGGYVLATRKGSPIGGECRTEQAARVVLAKLERGFIDLCHSGHMSDSW